MVWKDTEKNKWLAIYGQALPFAYDEKAGFCIKTVEFYRLVSSDGIHWKRSSRTPVFSREDGDIEAARIDGGPIYYDLQESDESKKLKLLYRLFDANGTPQERIAYSKDGKVWTTEILKGKNIFHSPASIFYNREEKSITYQIGFMFMTGVLHFMQQRILKRWKIRYTFYSQMVKMIVQQKHMLCSSFHMKIFI